MADNPVSAAALADAALFFAKTDVAGMTLLYGEMCGALDPARFPPDVARAMRTVLSQRITITRNGDDLEISARLAPGEFPALKTDHELLGPFAHSYEMLIGHAAGAVKPDLSTLDGAVSLLAVAAVMAGQNPPLLGSVDAEIHGWLRELNEAGHLDAFLRWLMSRGLEPELADDRTTAMLRYVAEHPFVPTRAVRPDDLAPLTQRG
jgi:hypothetical protein